MTFGNWNEELHSEIKQIPKIARAMTLNEADMVINPETQSAVFNGSDGTYDVTLNTCTCGSFKDKKPCKHMYLLAIKLGLFEEPPKKNPVAAKAFKAEIPNEIAKYKKLYYDGAISAEKFVSIANALDSKK